MNTQIKYKRGIIQMKTTPISKDMFVKCVSSLQSVADFQEGVLDLVNKYDPYADMGIFAYPSCEDQLLKLLQEVMDDEDLIGYFCYSLNFGRDWEEGDTEIPLATVDDLWETLTNR